MHSVVNWHYYLETIMETYMNNHFYIQRNLYESHKISNEGYRNYTIVDTATDCFKNPLMW